MSGILGKWRFPGKWKLFQLDDRLLLIFIGTIVGICSGVASVALNRSLEAFTEWLGPYRQLWWYFIIPGIGAALAVFFLENLLNEGASHGVSDVIYSISRRGGLLRFRCSFSRLVSSCLTIGSGGSAGPEAPVVVSGAAMGSNIARFFSLNERQRVALVGCGAAGAISSIFNAPITGIVFTVEVILREWAISSIVPVGIASVAGTEISRILQGNQIPFAFRYFNLHLIDIIGCIGLPLITAFASVFLSRGIHLTHEKFSSIFKNPWSMAFTGGCIVGLIGLYFPDVLGEGYPAVRSMIEGTYEKGLIIVAAGMVVKIIATSLTLGAGGVGGVFAPSLVIGSFAGLAYHRILVMLWPSVNWVQEGCFALLGMAGVTSGVLQAPLTGIFLIAEITGGYEVVVPLIFVSAVSTAIAHYIEPISFYYRSLLSRGGSLRPCTDESVLAALDLESLIEELTVRFKGNQPLSEILKVARKKPLNYYPVEDHESQDFLGILTLERLVSWIEEGCGREEPTAGDLIDERIKTADRNTDVATLLAEMDTSGVNLIAIVGRGKFAGVVSKARIFDLYRKELIRQNRLHQL